MMVRGENCVFAGSEGTSGVERVKENSRHGYRPETRQVVVEKVVEIARGRGGWFTEC